MRAAWRLRAGRAAVAISRAVVPLLCASAALLAVSGCGSPRVPVSDAFASGYVTRIGGTAIPPGARIGYLFAYLQNTSGSPLVIRSIAIHGRGIPAVVRPAEVEVAPITAGDRGIPGGIHVTDPPAGWTSRGCETQTLRPLAGYRMPPGGQARLWVVFQAVAPGSYLLPDYVIGYTQDGRQHTEKLSEGYIGAVKRGAPKPRPAQGEKRCLPGSHLLNG